MPAQNNCTVASLNFACKVRLLLLLLVLLLLLLLLHPRRLPAVCGGVRRLNTRAPPGEAVLPESCRVKRYYTSSCNQSSSGRASWLHACFGSTVAKPAQGHADT